MAIRVALIHDWLTGMRGGEIVLEGISELFPKSELFTLIYSPGRVSPELISLRKHTSWLQKIPKIEKRYRHFLPLMPKAIESFDLTGFDLVISSSHCVAKGIRKPPGSVHVSYVHAPMRYMWDRFDDYFGPGRSSLPVRLAAGAIRKTMQNWDRRVSQKSNVDLLLANSRFIAGQIEKNYGRTASVVYPFSDLSRFQHLVRKPGHHYLMVGAFAPYKRIDLAIDVFNSLGLPLLIVGGGQDEWRLKKIAQPNIEFLGPLSNGAIADLYSKCRALVFPGVEDFGITPLEAMASGAPVIALGVGGVSETVVDGKTGILFTKQTPAALREAILQMEKNQNQFDPDIARARAAEFSKTRFQKEFAGFVQQAWSEAGKNVAQLTEIISMS